MRRVWSSYQEYINWFYIYKKDAFRISPPIRFFSKARDSHDWPCTPWKLVKDNGLSYFMMHVCSDAEGVRSSFGFVHQQGEVWWWAGTMSKNLRTMIPPLILSIRGPGSCFHFNTLSIKATDRAQVKIQAVPGGTAVSRMSKWMLPCTPQLKNSGITQYDV